MLSLHNLYLAEYPKKYQELVEKYSTQYQVDDMLVYSVIRSESRFNPNAVSNIGACGLMQITEVEDISDIEETLATRPDHEEVTDQAADLLRQLGAEPFVLSSEACAACDRCAILDGQPCRFPERMHPCVESHGIVLTKTLEENGLEFQYGGNIVTWYSLLFYNDR